MNGWKFFGYCVLAMIVVALLGCLYFILHGSVIAHGPQSGALVLQP
jgi:hypothetical protein